jgi:hypothetical protein
MSTSYADRAQGVELDRRLDEWGNPKPVVNEFDLFHPKKLGSAHQRRHGADGNGLPAN